LHATITAYAYETVPGKRILAGITEKSGSDQKVQDSTGNLSGSSLGMLALGVDGLPLWRRNENEL
jgi:hypothetical protein